MFNLSKDEITFEVVQAFDNEHIIAEVRKLIKPAIK